MSQRSGQISGRALIVILYTMVAFGYAAWGAEVGKGLGGWLVDLGFRWFHSIMPRLGTVLAFVIAVLPGWFLAGALPSKPVPADPSSRPMPWWPWLILATVIGGAGPWLIYRKLDWDARADQQRRIYPLDLNADPAVPADAKFVAVTGFRLVDLQFTIKTSIYTQLKTSTSMTPIVGPDWKPGQPVTYFYQSGGSGSGSADTAYGRIRRNGLPLYLEHAFTREGLKVAKPYYLIEPVELDGGKVVPDLGQYGPLPWFGFATGPLALIVMAGVLLLARRSPEPPAPGGAA